MSLLTLTVVLALIATIATLAWGVGSMAMGGSYDKKHSEGVFKIGVIATSLMWIVRGFAQTLNQLILVDASAGAVSPFYWVTFDSLLYERSREKGEEVILFMVGRMLVVSLGMFIVLATLALFARHPMRFWVMWTLALTATLSTVFMWEKHKAKKR